MRSGDNKITEGCKPTGEVFDSIMQKQRRCVLSGYCEERQVMYEKHCMSQVRDIGERISRSRAGRTFGLVWKLKRHFS